MLLHGDPIAARAATAPHRRALLEPTSGRSRTYAELDRAGELAARRLHHGWGLRAGDRVAVLARNCLEQVELLLGAARLGVIVVPLNWRLAGPELAAMLEDAEPSVLLVDGVSAPQVPDGCAVPVVKLDRGWDGELLEPAPRSAIEASTPLLTLYTSGSTGRPKGAMLTHGSIHWNAINTIVGWELTAADSTVVAAPLFHTGGWNVLTIPLLMIGGTVLLAEAFDPDETLRLVQDHGLTCLFGVPTMFQAMRRSHRFATADLSSLDWVISGGAPCPLPEIEAWWDRGVEFRQGYGLTEVGPNCFVMPAGEGLARAGTVGFPMPHLEVRLVDEHDAPVAPGEVGELQLRGPTVCAGYWRQPEATAQALGDDGWFRTGDLFVEAPFGGFRCAGRRKEMFISGGENVYPGEVERVLGGIEDVLEAAVVPVEHPLWGEVGHAFVALRPGAKLAPEAIVALCRSRLAGYKVPRHVTALDELPKGATGKIHKPTLRELAAR
ncbi:MAG: long-chain fatty acid--CoA ligase [Proteobacteria bacterium]|nr:long-chain fatty acid--CoA ligase [Pseudomonadota bacterium]